eukprot:4283643-Amphidinium_carterae.1
MTDINSNVGQVFESDLRSTIDMCQAFESYFLNTIDVLRRFRNGSLKLKFVALSTATTISTKLIFDDCRFAAVFSDGDGAA